MTRMLSNNSCPRQKAFCFTDNLLPIPYSCSCALNVAGGCGAGYEADLHNITCTACDVGKFKDTEGFHRCQACPNTRSGEPAMTSSTGSNSVHQCWIDFEIARIEPQKIIQASATEVSIHVTSDFHRFRVASVHTTSGMTCELTQAAVTNGVIKCVTSPTHVPSVAGRFVIYEQRRQRAQSFTSSVVMFDVTESPRYVSKNRDQVRLANCFAVDSSQHPTNC